MRAKKRLTITRFLFPATFFLAWLYVGITYALAVYSIIFLGQVHLVEELSKQIAITALGPLVLKIIENAFEHNNGGIFGTSDKENQNGTYS